VGERRDAAVQAAAIGVEILVVGSRLVGGHPGVGADLRERQQLLASVEAAQLAVAGDDGGVETVGRGVVLAAHAGDQLFVEIDAAKGSGDEPQRHGRHQYALHLNSLVWEVGAGYQTMFVPRRSVRSVGTAPPSSGSMPT